MKTFKFIAFLFYRYYSTGPTKLVAYFSTICALAMLLLIHLFQLLIFFNLMNLVPTDGSQAKIGNWLRMALFLLPIFLILWKIIKEPELKEMHYEREKRRRGYIWLVIYIIACVVLLILLILFKKGKI